MCSVRASVLATHECTNSHLIAVTNKKLKYLNLLFQKSLCVKLCKLRKLQPVASDMEGRFDASTSTLFHRALPFGREAL